MTTIRTLLSVLSTVLVMTAAPAVARETDPGVLRAERTLRAAELRYDDAIALDLYRQASQQAEQALQRNRDSPGANFVYFAATGRILLKDGLTKNLIALRKLDRDYLDRAIELNPRYANALAAKGGVLLDLPMLLGGDPAQGLRLLRRAREINPGGAGTRVSLAKALAHHGHDEEARREIIVAAHLACIQGRRKALEDATALMSEMGFAPVAEAEIR